MTHIVSLSSSDQILLLARFEEHGNSQRRMIEALTRDNADEAAARLSALRSVERSHDLDLAEICVLYKRRNDEDTHPIEKLVLDFIVEEHETPEETQLWVLPDRVRQIRELMEGSLAGEPES